MKMTGEKILSKFYDRVILHRYVYPFVHKNNNREITTDNTLWLFCQPRGGSTWMAEILLNLPDSVLIDVPLWRGILENPWRKPITADRKVPRVAELDFYYNQYIPESESWLQAKNIFQEILTGRVPSKGLYEEQGYSRLRNEGWYITKFCYANLLMPWLVNQFEFNSILLTRHPCAVVASQLSHPSWKEINFDLTRQDDNWPFKEYYDSALSKIGNIESIEMYLAFIWALNFKETAMHPKNNSNWLTISYERLLLHFDAELERINERFSFDLNSEKIDFRKPSKSFIQPNHNDFSIEQQLSGWKSKLSAKQIADILKVLEIFEIDIYSFEVEPDHGKLYKNEKVS